MTESGDISYSTRALHCSTDSEQEEHAELFDSLHTVVCYGISATDKYTVQLKNKNWFDFSDIKTATLTHKMPVLLQRLMSQ